MEKIELFNDVVNIINENYLFLGEQKDVWNKYVENMKKNIQSVENMHDYLRDMLLILKDSHTNLFINNSPEKFFDLDFTWINNKIIIKPNIFGYSNEILDGELIEVNFESIDRIINKFESKLENFPKCIVQDEITKYINNNLKLKFKTIKVMKNNSVYIEKIKLIEQKDSNEIIAKRLNNIKTQFFPALITDIDQDTLLIKILTFNEIDIDKYLLNKYDLIKRKRRILFDVRNNKGGLISETKKVVSLIIKHDVELDYKIISRNGIERDFNKITTQHNDLFFNKEIIIVCNEYSMSSTEFIFRRTKRCVE